MSFSCIIQLFFVSLRQQNIHFYATHNIHLTLLPNESIHNGREHHRTMRQKPLLVLRHRNKTSRHHRIEKNESDHLPCLDHTGHKTIKTYIFPDELEKIGDFYLCNATELLGISIPQKVTKTGKRASSLTTTTRTTHPYRASRSAYRREQKPRFHRKKDTQKPTSGHSFSKEKGIIYMEVNYKL